MILFFKRFEKECVMKLTAGQRF